MNSGNCYKENKMEPYESEWWKGDRRPLQSGIWAEIWMPWRHQPRERLWEGNPSSQQQAMGKNVPGALPSSPCPQPRAVPGAGWPHGHTTQLVWNSCLPRLILNLYLVTKLLKLEKFKMDAKVLSSIYGQMILEVVWNSSTEVLNNLCFNGFINFMSKSSVQYCTWVWRIYEKAKKTYNLSLPFNKYLCSVPADFFSFFLLFTPM